MRDCAATADGNDGRVRIDEKMTTKKPGKSVNRGSPVAEESAALGPHRRRAAATRTKARPIATSQGITDLPEQQVRVRAYFLSLERKKGPADPVADWLRAEHELIVEESGG